MILQISKERLPLVDNHRCKMAKSKMLSDNFAIVKYQHIYYARPNVHVVGTPLLAS